MVPIAPRPVHRDRVRGIARRRARSRRTSTASTARTASTVGAVAWVQLGGGTALPATGGASRHLRPSASPTGTPDAWDVLPAVRSVLITRRAVRLTTRRSSRANPSRGGDAKPRTSTRRPPGCRPRAAISPRGREGVDSEGEPGALHVDRHGDRRDGSDGGRWDPVELAVKTKLSSGYLRLLMALMTVASSALVLQAGQRWH